jgi:cyanophycin synthetase
LANGSDETSLIKLAELQPAVGDRAVREIEYVLAAVGAAWALGISLGLIRLGIETFGFGQEKSKTQYQDFPEKQEI